MAVQRLLSLFMNPEANQLPCSRSGRQAKAAQFQGNNSRTRLRSLPLMLALMLASPFSAAMVSPEEAAKLKTELTPFGAERAGNKDGSIPAWEGGYTKVPPDYRPGQPQPDPFANEKPIAQITAKNMNQYADLLSDGQKALLQREPTFRLDVYPTHRTAAAPEWVYENTFANATRAQLVNSGLTLTGAYGGIPFPIPRNGTEAMWNHLLPWKGEAYRRGMNTYLVPHGRAPVQASAGEWEVNYRYYEKNGSPGRFDGWFSRTFVEFHSPPHRAGESLMIHESVDRVSGTGGRLAWTYLPGQRRVRRTPQLLHDHPDFLTSGISVVDENGMFNGPVDRYDWKLIGKREMIVPYNNNGFHSRPVAQVLGPRTLNPDTVRWERHRVWVIEATLLPGKRHVLPKRRFYQDEDSWHILMADGWDQQGQLWHTSHVLTISLPQVPVIMADAPFIMYDLLKGAYGVSNMYNEITPQYTPVSPRPDADFSPGALVRGGIR